MVRSEVCREHVKHVIPYDAGPGVRIKGATGAAPTGDRRGDEEVTEIEVEINQSAAQIAAHVLINIP